MRSMFGRGRRLLAPLAIAALVAGACAPSHAKPTPTPTPTAIPTAASPTVVVRWFVGLGKGNDGAQIVAEKAFVAHYNASQSQIYIDLEIVPGSTAAETLKAEVANGTGPDIIGPVGVGGRNGMGGLFLDLTDEVSKTSFDMTRYPEGVVDMLKDGKNGLVGLPYLISPGFIFYNKDIFARSNLPPLPKRVGDTWNGKPWTWDTVAALAAQLTVDAKKKKSTDANFDPNQITQYGIDFQWSDLRRTASCFGAGSLIDTNGTAVVPDSWQAALTWYYNAIWTKHIAPSARVVNSPLLGTGSTVASGRVAMAVSWPWAISTYAGSPAANGTYKPAFASWDIAIMPSYNGSTTDPTDADSFGIAKTSAHPDQAFQAMLAIMADPDLQVLYGGMPAAKADQQAWFDQFDAYIAKLFPGNKISWTVLQEMENFPAVPSPEVDVPNAGKVNSITSSFYTKLQTIQGLTLANEFTNLQAQLQKAFDTAPATAAP